MPSLLILMPLLGIVILNLPLRDIMKKAAFGFAVFIFTLQIFLAISHNPIFWNYELSRIDDLFKVNFSLDQLSFIMLLCVGIVSLASLLVARHMIYDINDRFKFINLLILCSIGMSGIVMVKDLFSLYVFLEVTAIASFILIAFNKDIFSLEGAFKYLMLSAMATFMILTAIALFFMCAGDTSFSAVKMAISSNPSNIVMFSIGLFICGLLIKGGVMPFHAWVPDAYCASPAAVSVLLAGVVTKAAGIYTLIRVISSIFGFNSSLKMVMLTLGAMSIILGAIIAMKQKDIKRMLAYSSISQIGYILIGFGCGTFLGIAGAIFHIFNHSIFKALLFTNSAAVETQLSTTNIDRMGGLATRMPYTGITSVIGMLSAAGVPPLSSFWSKLMIIMALWQSHDHVFAFIAALASVLTLAYMLILQRQVFFGKISENNKDITEAKPGITIASVSLALILLGTGIFFPFIYKHFISSLESILR